MLSNPIGLSPEAARSKLAVDQATAALRAGNPGEAEQLLRMHLVACPRDAAALAKLAELSIEGRRVEEATGLLRRAAGADPTAARRMALVRHLQRFGSPALVLQEIESLPPAERSTFETLAIEAQTRGFLGDHERQIALYEQLVSLNPAIPGLWKNYGDALKTVGRTDEAIVALRKAIGLRPTFGEAWWTLSNFKSARFDDRDISAMRKALRSKLSDEDALHFHFALGQAFEDRRDFARSFHHYDEGNRIRRGRLPAEAMRVTGFVDQAIATFGEGLFDRHRGAGADSGDPIFVLGLHRSGSTLVEQILASHPEIEGTAELTVLPQIWERIARFAGAAGRTPFEEVARMDGEALRAIGEEYVERTRAFRTTDRPRFVDKLPANWMNIGLIRLALPNARIIDARRHPMACGFSNFKQNYATGVTFSYSQESIGHFYRDYARYLDHIGQVQPGTVHRVINERLIDDPEGETRRLLEFVGVPFDPACLDSHRTKRAVQTPSAEQVRRPINRDGVDAWRGFEPWLGPMKEALGPVLDDWERL
jgi:tetratricopeptide (TPR) repeat protein